jgi:hypothetical protein
LGFAVLVAFLTHAIVGALAERAGSPVAWDQILDAMHMGGASAQKTARRVAKSYDAHPGRIPLYVLSTVVFGYAIGLAAGLAAAAGWVPGVVQYPWAYDIRQTKEGVDKITYAHVLSNVEYSGKVLLYRGRPKHFGLNADGTFSYIALAGTQQRFLDLTGGDPVVRDLNPIGGTIGAQHVSPPGRFQQALSVVSLGLFKASPKVEYHVGGALMFITGSNIRSVVFQSKFELQITHIAKQMDRYDQGQSADPTALMERGSKPVPSESDIEAEIEQITQEEEGKAAV